jgi:hypothetical protein
MLQAQQRRELEAQLRQEASVALFKVVHHDIALYAMNSRLSYA